VLRLLQRLFAPSGTLAAKNGTRPRLVAEDWPAAVYAIGDVHGCRGELDVLEAKIADDAGDVQGEKWLVMLGDYVDRGPRSADVLDRLVAAPPRGFRRISIAGNHEIMMLAFLSTPSMESNWLRFGGIETLASYQINIDDLRVASPSRRRQILQSHIPYRYRWPFPIPSSFMPAFGLAFRSTHRAKKICCGYGSHS
jgi:serine/threonine protein phosphatase 1